jgi:hypothetical protein
MAGNFGLKKVIEACLRLERLAQTGKLAQCREACRTLQDHLDQLMLHFSNWLNNNPAPAAEPACPVTVG